MEIEERSFAPHSGHGAVGAPREQSGHRGHGHWMMIACCIPMLLIALALVATGVVGAGFILFAVVCTALMALMMGGMSHGGDGGSGPR